MALPDYPITRNEQYLNNIATGSGELPEYPVSREEQYLAYIAEHGGGGGGGLPPVSGSGKALVSVNGEWVEQSGFPYDEGETVETKFDETFTNFTRGTEETHQSFYPIESSDPYGDENVVIDGDTYFHISAVVRDYIGVGDDCTVVNENSDYFYPTDLELAESGEVKKVEIPYTLEDRTGTLYGVCVPTDGAQDADGNVFPYAGVYASVKGDILGEYVGLEYIALNYMHQSDFWTATVPLDSGIEFDNENPHHVYVDGEAAEGAFVDDSSIYLDANENSYVNIEEDEGFTATAYLNVEVYESAPESMGVKVDEVVSGLSQLDAKYVVGGAELEKAVATHGIGWYQNGWAQKIYDEELELSAGEENWVGTSLLQWNTPVGTPAKVEFDGTLYEGTIQEVSYYDNLYLSFGNRHLIDPGAEDTGEPFCIRWSSDTQADNWWVAESGTYTVSGWIEGKEKIKIDSDYIPWDSMPSDAIPWYDAPTGTGLPEPTYEDGTYVLQATESDGEMSYEWSAADTVSMEVTYDDDTTETFDVLIRPTE